MNKKIINNFVYQGIYQVSTLVFPIITIPIVSNALEAKVWGHITTLDQLSLTL